MNGLITLLGCASIVFFIFVFLFLCFIYAPIGTIVTVIVLFIFAITIYSEIHNGG